MSVAKQEAELLLASLGSCILNKELALCKRRQVHPIQTTKIQFGSRRTVILFP